jgi:DNA repair exonuclease SbcCD ATPase subunit
MRIVMFMYYHEPQALVNVPRSRRVQTMKKKTQHRRKSQVTVRRKRVSAGDPSKPKEGIMTNEQESANAQTEVPRDVDRIRDILFGGQMREYEQRFQVMQRDLERLQQELDRLNEQLGSQDGEQNKKLQTLRRDLKQANDELRSELRQTTQALTNEKIDRAALGELFAELGNRLKTGSSVADLLASLVQSEPGRP